MTEIQPSISGTAPGAELTFTVRVNVDPAHQEAIGREIARRLEKLGELAIDGQVEVYQDIWPTGPEYEELRARRREQAEIEQLMAKAKLSEREREVGRLLGCGLGDNEIGALLCITPLTVKSHLHRMYGKTGVRNRYILGAMFHGVHPKRWEEMLSRVQAESAAAQQLPRKF